jgi:hypothetical protein
MERNRILIEENQELRRVLKLSTVYIEDSRMGACMAKLYGSKEWSDFTFVIQRKELPVHRVLVAHFSHKLAEVI